MIVLKTVINESKAMMCNEVKNLVNCSHEVYDILSINLIDHNSLR